MLPALAGVGAAIKKWWSAHRSDVIQLGVALVTDGLSSAGELSPEQASNLSRFEKNMPKGAGETIIRDLPGNSKAFQSEVPGRVPGSKAVYEKQVDASGNTLEFTKTTVDPAGNDVHVKDKIRKTTIYPQR
jgi:hypothetical protein